jgi:hypothetical protein
MVLFKNVLQMINMVKNRISQKKSLDIFDQIELKDNLKKVLLSAGIQI